MADQRRTEAERKTGGESRIRRRGSAFRTGEAKKRHWPTRSRCESGVPKNRKRPRKLSRAGTGLCQINHYNYDPRADANKGESFRASDLVWSQPAFQDFSKRYGRGFLRTAGRSESTRVGGDASGERTGECQRAEKIAVHAEPHRHG